MQTNIFFIFICFAQQWLKTDLCSSAVGFGPKTNKQKKKTLSSQDITNPSI